MSSSIEEKVVTITVVAKVAGHTLEAQEATLSLAVNEIPTIELMCAPTVDVPGTPLKPSILKPHISDYAKMYRELSDAAESLSEECNITINILDSDGRADNIELKKWILAGAGLSSIDATSAPYLSVVVQHPICKLTKVGSIYEIPKSDQAIKLYNKVKGSSDVLQIMTKAYAVARSETEYWPVPPEDKYSKQFRQRLGTGEFDPNKYLECGGDGKIFLVEGSDGSDLRNRMIEAIADLVVPEGGKGSSTWDTLVSMSGTLMLSIVQDEGHNFTKDKLLLEPTRPWKRFKNVLDERMCHSTEVPGMDPFKIIGVMCRKLGPYSNTLNLGLLKNGEPHSDDTKVLNSVFYAPEDLGNIEDSEGRIMIVRPAYLIEAVFARDAAYGGAIATANIEGAKTAADGYNGIVMKYCKAVYEISTASMVRAKAQMALGFKDMDGNLLLPGNTCKFVSQGEDIYYGYMTNIVHHMSTRGGCSTNIAMSHVRPYPGYKINKKEVIKENAPNAAYE